MVKNSFFLIDYYFTKKIEERCCDEYNIVDKTIVRGYSSDGKSLGDNIDIFIPHKEFPSGKIPQKHDLIFFTPQKRFYEAVDYQDAGEFFIINVKPCKYKDK